MGKHICITGGAGFIGANAAKHFLDRGYRVTILDDLSRRGVKANVDWLKSLNSDQLAIIVGSITNFDTVRQVTADADAILHLAAQVAVTTSVTNPRSDFEINCLGAFNVLEAARLSGRKPVTLYSSTNKVYGGMEGVVVEEHASRYAYRDLPLGIPETFPLDFHSPYGCSKGSADQYFRDYARIYDLPTMVFRQSCIYGTRQFGNEDQGWVAHFIISAVLGRPLTIYGDGKQVRDLLFVEDLCELYRLAIEQPQTMSGQVYNVGGSANYSVSLLELVAMLEKLLGRKIKPAFGDWRPGDQKIYVSDVRAVQKACGWQPRTSPEAGVGRLLDWVQANPELFPPAH
jgi:CDP-paratose 2-epimerase